MRVIYHNWSATKQRPHPQSVSEISHHSVLSGDRIRNVRHRLGLATRTQISVCKLPFPSAGTAVSLFRAKTVRCNKLMQQCISYMSLSSTVTTMSNIAQKQVLKKPTCIKLRLMTKYTLCFRKMAPFLFFK